MELNVYDENDQACLKIIVPTTFNRTLDVVFDVTSKYYWPKKKTF